MSYSRRDALRIAAAAAGALALGRDPLLAVPSWLQDGQLLRTIPSSGEPVPAVGFGTGSFSRAARIFEEHSRLREVLRLFTELGGKVIDAPPTYLESERVLGRLTEEIGNQSEIFWAAKLSILASGGRDAGMMQVAQSLERLGHIDLYQIHDLLRWQIQLPLLHELKEQGRIRYVGMTASDDRQYEELERILRTEVLDFVQLDYAIDNRAAEEALIPVARDRGIAIMVSGPFGGGRLFRRVSALPFPEWAGDFGARTWAQFFLKWVLGNEAVTVAIPGTSDPEHLRDNLDAGKGRLPTEAERTRMARLVGDLP